MVVDGRYVVDTQEFHLIARLEHVANVEEHADAGRAFPLVRYRENQLVTVDNAEVSAIRVADADIVSRTQTAFSKASDAVGTAGEVVEVRRQGGRFAERRGIVDRGLRGYQELAPQRYVGDEIEIRLVVLNVAQGQ